MKYDTSKVNIKSIIAEVLQGQKAETGHYGFVDMGKDTDGLLGQIYGPEWGHEISNIKEFFSLMADSLIVENELEDNGTCIILSMINKGEIHSPYSADDKVTRMDWKVEQEEDPNRQYLSFQILSKNPDERDFLYHGLKALLLRMRSQYPWNGIIRDRLVSGWDEPESEIPSARIFMEYALGADDLEVLH